MSEKFKKITLKQQGRFGDVREFLLVNKNELKIGHKSRIAVKTYMVHLLSLSEKSHTRLHFSKLWLTTALIFSVLVVSYYYNKDKFVENLGSTFDLLIVLGLGISILICLIMLLLNISVRRVFVSKVAKVPLFEVLVNRPDKKSYKDFTSQLKATIDEARRFWKPRDEQQNAGELRMLRRLSEEGIINMKVYTQAKNKLFKKENKKS